MSVERLAEDRTKCDLRTSCSLDQGSTETIDTQNLDLETSYEMVQAFD